MPSVAGAIGGAVAGGIGGALNQNAANKPPRAVYPGLQGQGISGLSSIAGPGFAQLLSLINTGNPVDTTQMTQTLSAQNNLQTNQNLAQLREQFGSAGLGSSSPAAVGTSNLLTQSTANFMNTLAQLRYQSSTDAANRQSQATEFGLSAFLGPAFTDIGPKGSVIGAALGGGQSGAASGANTAINMQMLALLQSLEV